MDLKLGSKRPDGRECLTGPEFTADESLLGCEHHLVEDRLAGPEIKPE
jgi:hypothetical protein